MQLMDDYYFTFKGQRSKSSGTKKNEKVCHFVRVSSSGVWSSWGIFSGAVLGARLRRWENQRTVSSNENAFNS